MSKVLSVVRSPLFRFPVRRAKADRDPVRNQERPTASVSGQQATIHEQRPTNRSTLSPQTRNFAAI
ncbi:MAG: hypothetical protein ABW007_25175 [Chitinophagaceae bacterium]